MTFRFQVHASRPQEVKKSVKDLIKHFEGNLDYKLKKITCQDSTEDAEQECFPDKIILRKETLTEVRKDEGPNFTTISLVKYEATKKEQEWNRTMCFALRPRQQDEDYRDEDERKDNDPKREEKLQKRKEKMKENLEETKEHLWRIKDDVDF